jgi:protein-S-isoprenylcysteine O-methyltransferase Ste14
MWLMMRAAVWAAVLPGLTVFYIPWRVFGVSSAAVDITNPGHLGGVVLFAAGSSLLAACIWEFAQRGGGTLSPLDPPRRLVISGLYRFVRNPMYVGGALVLIGTNLIAPSLGLLAYSLTWFALVSTFVRLYEEPALRRAFPDDYQAYFAAVPRWIPRLTPARRDPAARARTRPSP